jgi:hypothetical protein
MGNNMENCQKEENETVYDLAIPLLAIYPEEMKLLYQRDICMLIATLLVTAKM